MGRIRVLSELKPGEIGKVKRIEGEGRLKKRLLDMGVVSGTIVEVIKVAPLGDPIDIKVKGYHLSLRKEEAVQILIEEE
ncbi:ferrous iron transport protein A [bacterium]|nr:ferrous iron transport protein A [bacterium]